MANPHLKISENMTAHLILYTATANLEYGFIAKPGTAVFPRTILRLFEKRIKGLLSSETVIKEPKWMLCKEITENYSYILWGVACMTSFISDLPLNDKEGRTIQCFIGFVIENPDEQLKLPYRVDAFKKNFNEIIKRKRDSLNPSPENIQIVIEDLVSTSYIRAEKGNLLNYNQNSCRFFPSGLYSDELLFAEALGSQATVSLATSIEYKSDVTNPEFEPLMNAVLIKSSVDVKDVSVKRICKKCKIATYNLIDGLCENCRSERVDDENLPNYICEKCGKETNNLLNGLCQECTENQNRPVCKKCKRQVDVLNKGGICNNCRKEKSLKLLMVVLIAILSIVCLIKCSHSKTHSGIPDWKDAHVLEMTSTQDKTTDTTCITKN